MNPLKSFFTKFKKSEETHEDLPETPRPQKAIPFYADYPEQPYISPNRDVTKWLDVATTDTNWRVPKDNMYRDDMGLLPGDIFLLYWLFRYRNTDFPYYFEYFFGINPFDEMDLLVDKHLLDEHHKLTPLGCEQIDDYAVYLNQIKPIIKKRFPDDVI